VQTRTFNFTSAHETDALLRNCSRKKKQFGAVLYDFTKAYDRVPKHILLQKMIKLEIPAYLIQTVYNWLSDRKFTVAIRGFESRPHSQDNGSLSVLLWIICVYDIPLNPRRANTYVDDTIGWAIGYSKAEIKDKTTGATH